MPMNPDARYFWENRYASDPALGSGVGSKGLWKERKLDLLAQIRRRHPIRRVVDLGCGDLQVLGDLPRLEELEYTGIDFSAEVIARNRARFPGLRFIHADLGDVETLGLETPDLVICFDVLFHIQDASAYNKVCSYMFNSGARALAFTCAVGRGDANGVNLWYRDFWQQGEALGLSYVRKIERPFRMPWERLAAVDLAEPGRDQPTEVVYVCSPDREAQLAASLGSLLRSGSSVDRAAVFWIGERRPPRFADPRISVQPALPRFADYFFGNKALLCTRRASRVIFLDTDTVVLRPLDRLWDGRAADFLARPGTAYGHPDWDQAAWGAAFAAAGTRELPMFNGGLLVFQNHAHRQLRESWEAAIREYLDERLPYPFPDPRMPEQWGLALALAARQVTHAELGPGDHAFGWLDEPVDGAIVFHTGTEHYSKYAHALGPDAAPAEPEPAPAAAPIAAAQPPAPASAVAPAARLAELERELAALRASRTLALGNFAKSFGRLLLALCRCDLQRARGHWRDFESARRLLAARH